MREAISTYWALIGQQRARTAAAVALYGLFGLLEGLGLLVLVPIIEGAVSGAVSKSFAARWLLGMFPASDDLLKAALGLFLLFGAGAALARFTADTTLYSLRARMEESVRLETARALLDTDWSRFISLRQGDITKALIAEGMHISWGTYAFVAALGSALITAMYFVTALAISIEMTAITVAFSFVGILAYVFAWNWVKQFSDRLSNLTSDLGERVGDIFGNLKFVRSVGATQAAEDHASRVFGEYRKVYFYSQAAMPALRTIFEVAAVVFLVAFLYWSLLVAREPAAPVLVFLVVFYRLVPRVIAVQDGLFASATYLSWYRSWKERLDFVRAHPQARHGSAAPSFDRGVEFQRVTFHYDKAERETLREINLSVRPGECVALVGTSGGGKSTLIDLVTGLVSPDSGSLLLDGQPLPSFDLDRWRARLGIVLQDSPLFHETIFENIVWGQAVRDRDRVIACARRAHAWEFIEHLPQGLDTLVGQRGARLSGGQRQRIAIARALYREPWLLILDEATSALDGESEAAIQTALEEMKGRTAVLMVAHRLKTVGLADRIYVIELGRVVESGTWDELASKGGRFAAMIDHQALDSGGADTPGDEAESAEVAR